MTPFEKLLTLLVMSLGLGVLPIAIYDIKQMWRKRKEIKKK